MSKLPTGFEIGGVYFYRHPNDPYKFFYIPGEPVAEVSPSGEPTLSLMVSDQLAILQLESRWELDAQQQQAIEQDLQHQFPEMTSGMIRLSPAPVTMKQTLLQLGDGDGNFELLQTVSLAGYPPFAALFNVELTSKQKTQAIAALNGRENFLIVTYQGTLAATLTANELLTIERSTDISTWFEGNTGLDHVRVLLPVAKEPEPTSAESLTVRLGFDAQDSAIAFIQVKFGEAQATLRPPKFDTVTFLSVQCSSSLTITTHYTDGGSSWQNQLPFVQGAELSLNPKDVGLALIVVDASARKQAGSTSLQIRVKYIPTSDGTEDERILYFGHGQWTDSWYIVTRSTDLGGVLEFEAQETTSDDVVIKHPLTTTKETEIKL